MKIKKTDRGFHFIEHDQYPPDPITREVKQGMLVQESSMIGDYDDSWKPGSSYLWVDEHFHLDREEVAELVKYLQRWLETGRLA